MSGSHASMYRVLSLSFGALKPSYTSRLSHLVTLRRYRMNAITVSPLPFAWTPWKFLGTNYRWHWGFPTTTSIVLRPAKYRRLAKESRRMEILYRFSHERTYIQFCGRLRLTFIFYSSLREPVLALHKNSTGSCYQSHKGRVGEDLRF